MAVKQPTKFTEAEIASLKEIQTEMDQTIVRFGQIAVNREALESQENLLKQSLSQLKVKEQNLAQSLSEKYGKGTIDLSSGKFTPNS